MHDVSSLGPSFSPLIFGGLRTRQITPSYAYGCMFTDSVYPERLRNDNVIVQCELETLRVTYLPNYKMVICVSYVREGIFFVTFG